MGRLSEPAGVVLRHPCDATASPREPRLAGRTRKAVLWAPYVGFLPLGRDLFSIEH